MKLQGRLALVRVLGWAPRRVAIGLIGFHAVYAALPALGAVAASQVIGHLAADRQTIPVVNIVFLCAVLAANVSVMHTLNLANTHIARTIDGRVRSEVRQAMSRLDSLGLAERPDFLDDVALAATSGGAGGYEQSIGTGVSAQVQVMARMVSTVITALVIVPFSPVLAVVVFALAWSSRFWLRRLQLSLAESESLDAAGRRRTAYWAELAAGQGAAKELRLFGIGGWTVDRHRDEALGYMVPRWQARIRLIRAQWVALLLAVVGGFLVLGVPSWYASRGLVGAEDMVRYIVAGFAVLGLSGSVGRIFAIEHAQFALTALTRIRSRIRDAQHEGQHVAQVPGGPTSTPDAIELRGVSFAYGDRPAVLQHIDLSLAPGEVVAVVGPNGAGKTSLVKLLCGLYRPTLGTIQLPVPPEQWRHEVAVLFQDYVRYPLSLTDNVMLSAPDHVDEAGVRRALALAGAEDLVAQLPRGQRTVLSKLYDGGVDLSGGQWQKIALARAIYAAQHGRRLLIMDEPTAHLDAAVEADFYDRVVRALTGVAVVMISHRLSTVRSADRILLLDHGAILEQGSHDQLMLADGRYAEMFRLQASRFTSGSLS